MVNQRNVGMSIFLSIITCGIYGIYWYICINDEVNMVTGQPGTSGGMVFLLTFLTCGIYGIYWAYKMGEKLDQARARQGVPTGSLAILYLVLSCVGLTIVAWALMQSELNHYTPDGGAGSQF